MTVGGSKSGNRVTKILAERGAVPVLCFEGAATWLAGGVSGLSIALSGYVRDGAGQSQGQGVSYWSAGRIGGLIPTWYFHSLSHDDRVYNPRLAVEESARVHYPVRCVRGAPGAAPDARISAD